MADKRTEARRRRILENQSKRLEKLQSLSSLDVDEFAQEKINDQNFHQDVIPNECDTTEIKDDEDENFNEDDDYKDINEDDNVDNTESSKNINIPVNSKDDLQPSWLMKKYRLLLFSLLAWGIYLVVAKDFDFVLAYLIGKKLPSDVVTTLILTSFVAVELQVIGASFVLKGSPEPKSVPMFVLALSLCGISKKLISIAGLLISVLFNILTDFCVYIFVIVILHTLDEKI